MGKKLPLTKRLEIGLNTCNSDTERDQFYGLLYKTAKNITKSNDLDDFYSRFASYEKFTLDKNRKKISDEEIVKGKDLASHLKNSVNIPSQGTPKYRTKMVGALEFEFNFLKTYWID